MNRVMYLTTERRELEYAIQLAPQLGLEIYPNVIPSDDLKYVKEYVAIAEKLDVDVILTKGRILAILQSLGCTVPIVTDQVAGRMTTRILYHLKRDMGERYWSEGGKRRKVGLFTHQPLFIDEKMYGEIFGMEIVNVVFPASMLNRREEFLREQKKKGFDVIVCGQTTKRLAEGLGMTAYYQVEVASQEMVWDSLRTASVVAGGVQNLKVREKETRELLDFAFDAVLVTDGEGKIRFCNGAAARFLEASVESLQGEEIWQSFPPLDQERFFSVTRDEKKILGNAVGWKDRRFRMNAVPLREQGKSRRIGAAVYLTELPRAEAPEAPAARPDLPGKGGQARYNFQNILGESFAIHEAKQMAEQFAGCLSNVLLLGETGTGKELFAQSIHNASERKDGPFVALNCGAIAPNLLESELFGYAEGAFTGASRKGKKGLLEMADGGTIFLDEISEMELQGQVRLLRVLEERTLRRVGDDKEIPVNIRVIAASNKNLIRQVEKKKFREDLYYRLNVLSLLIPPLRERERDPVLLARHFLDSFGREHQKSVSITPPAEEVIAAYPWPGNVRQLRNFCERLVVVAGEQALDAEFILRQLKMIYTVGEEEGNLQLPPSGEEGADVDTEREKVIWALNRAGGKRQEAARILGISKSSLWRKMKKYEIGEKF